MGYLIFQKKFSDWVDWSSPEVEGNLYGDISGGNFGRSIVVNDVGDEFVVSATYNAVDTGRVYRYKKSGGAWVRVAEIVPSDGDIGDSFGCRVVISRLWDEMFVGSRRNDNSKGVDAGAVYVYVMDVNGDWVFSEKILPFSGTAGDQFGSALAISDDGLVLVVGAVYDDTGGVANSGAVYVYRKVGGVWQYEAKLLASDRASNDNFGTSVDISGDGLEILVGSWTSSVTADGAVYVYRYENGSWVEKQKLVANNQLTGERFGMPVRMVKDGSEFAVGAFYEDNERGAVYVYRKVGGVWVESQVLLASDIAGGDRFGISLDYSRNGRHLVVGSQFDDNDRGIDAGAAYIFSRGNNQLLTEVNKVVPNDLVADDYFGLDVKFSGDGRVLVVGSRGDDNINGVDTGRVFVIRA